MNNTWNEEETGRFATIHGNRVWTLDEEAADLLLWFGADVIWGPGPVMMQDGQYLVNGIPQDPAGFPACELTRGCGRLVKEAIR